MFVSVTGARKTALHVCLVVVSLETYFLTVGNDHLSFRRGSRGVFGPVLTRHDPVFLFSFVEKTA